ncbi:MAG: DUF3160 domain-containing protein [Fimbriimonadaceae bacterium]|nr:DUF3160 domain-containing protein [Fimbriimonadaceae bacterium]
MNQQQRRHRRIRRPAVLLVAGLLTACRAPAPPAPPAPASPREPGADDARNLATPSAGAVFAGPAYSPAAARAVVPEYRLKPDLREVVNLKQQRLPAAAKARLAAVGFVALPSPAAQLDELYRDALADGQPLLITADSALWAFEGLTADTRRRVLGESLPALLRSVTLALLERSQQQQTQLANPDWVAAARRNTAWFAVAAGLLGLTVQVEAGAAELATGERQRITRGAGIETGGLLDYPLDYRQFTPPATAGSLAGAELARRWYAAAPLALELGRSGGLTTHWPAVRQAALLALAAAAEPGAPLPQAEALYDTLRFLDGGAGLSLADAVTALREVYTPTPTLRGLTDQTRLERFRTALGTALPPDLLPASPADGAPSRLVLRLAPDGRTWDRDALARAELGAVPLNLFAALGNPLAETLRPAEQGRHGLDELRRRLSGLDPGFWRADLAWAPLWAAVPQAAQPEGLPMFQRNGAWARHTLLTSLAVWAAARHRSSSLRPAGPPEPRSEPAPPARPPVVWVEPTPEVYSRLLWLSRRSTAGLGELGLITPDLSEAHSVFQQQMQLLQRVAERELRNDSPTVAERAELALWGHRLHWLTRGRDTTAPAAEQAVPRVWRPGSGPLLVGVGPVLRLLVVVPDSGRFHLATGAALSYLEVRHDPPALSDDAAWQAALAGGTPPPLPSWSAACIVPDPALRLARPATE